MRIAALIDRWDERNAAQDDPYRPKETLSVGASLAFGGADPDSSLEALSRLVRQRLASANSFYTADHGYRADFHYEGDLLTFRSAIATETPANNIVHAHVRESRQRRNAIVILPHWNAPPWAYRDFTAYFARLSITTVELTLPYHGARKRDGAMIADYLLSANLGRTIRSFRQAVVDTRAVIDWLTGRGYEKIGLIGVSIGSCIAALVAAHDPRVRSSALLLAAGDFAEVVWTGRATQHIRRMLEPALSLDQLKAVWSILSPELFASELARPQHSTLIVSGARDRVVQPYLTQRLADQLRSCQASLQWKPLPCGHYSLALFPFNLMAFASLALFSYRNGLLR